MKSYIAVVRMPNGSLRALMDEYGYLREWTRESDAITETRNHVLAPLQFQYPEILTAKVEEK